MQSKLLLFFLIYTCASCCKDPGRREDEIGKCGAINSNHPPNLPLTAFVSNILLQPRHQIYKRGLPSAWARSYAVTYLGNVINNPIGNVHGHAVHFLGQGDARGKSALGEDLVVIPVVAEHAHFDVIDGLGGVGTIAD